MFTKQFQSNLLGAGKTGIDILHHSQGLIHLSERLKYISYNGSIQAAIIQGVKAYSLKELANSLAVISNNFIPSIISIEKRCTNFSKLIIRTILLMEVNIKNELSMERMKKLGDSDNKQAVLDALSVDYNNIQDEIYTYLLASKDDIINFRYIINSISKDSVTIKYIGSNILIDTANFGKKRSSFVSLVDDINGIANDLNKVIDEIDILIDILNKNIKYLLSNTKL